MRKPLDAEHILLALAIVASAVVVIVLVWMGKAEAFASLVAALGGVSGIRALLKPSPRLNADEPFARGSLPDDLGVPVPGVPVQIGTVAPADATNPGSIYDVITPRAFAQALLGELGLPLSENNVAAMTSAAVIEAGFMKNAALYNPLNTTLHMPGSRTVTSIGVQAFTSWAQGLEATVKSLRNGLYNDILSSLARDAPPDETLRVMQLGPWGWYKLVNGQKVPYPIGKASYYMRYADQPYPAGGGPLPGAGLGGVALVALALGTLYALSRAFPT